MHCCSSQILFLLLFLHFQPCLLQLHLLTLTPAMHDHAHANRAYFYPCQSCLFTPTSVHPLTSTPATHIYSSHTCSHQCICLRSCQPHPFMFMLAMFACAHAILALLCTQPIMALYWSLYLPCLQWLTSLSLM